MSLRSASILVVLCWLAAFAADAGSLYRGVCFPSAEVQRAEFCASYHAVWGNGANALSVECVDSDFTDGTFQACRRTNGGSCSNTTVSYPVAPSCSYDGTFNDSFDLFLLALGFLVTVWLSKRMLRVFWGNHEGA